MFKIATIAVIMLFIYGMTFVSIPSALSFEDYIFVETTVQEEVETNEVPATGGDGLYYEESQNEREMIGEEEVLEQEEMQETEQPLYEEEQEEIQ